MRFSRGTTRSKTVFVGRRRRKHGRPATTNATAETFAGRRKVSVRGEPPHSRDRLEMQFSVETKIKIKNFVILTCRARNAVHVFRKTVESSLRLSNAAVVKLVSFRHHDYPSGARRTTRFGNRYVLQTRSVSPGHRRNNDPISSTSFHGPASTSDFCRLARLPEPGFLCSTVPYGGQTFARVVRHADIFFFFFIRPFYANFRTFWIVLNAFSLKQPRVMNAFLRRRETRERPSRRHGKRSLCGITEMLVS